MPVTNINSHDNIQLRLKAMGISFIAGILILVMKFSGYFITGSAAILSDALESIINVVASGFAFYSVKVSSKPADRSHPYGHGKIEFFSAGFEGALIILAAIAIFYASIPEFFHANEIKQLDKGIILVLTASVSNLILGIFLIRSGKKSKSIAVESDGKHVLTDVYTSFGVIIALILIHLTGWFILDPVIACIVALNILISGGKIVRLSYGRLMDEADPKLLKKITEILNSNRYCDWIDAHHLRVWLSGSYHHVDMHLTLPRFWELEKSHSAEKRVESLILESLGEDGEAIVHIDPCVSECCKFCAYEPCNVRSSEFKFKRTWTEESITGDPAYLKNSL